MQSYLVITQDRETDEVEMKARLFKEKTELLAIRHYIVEHITKLITPEPHRVTFN